MYVLGASSLLNIALAWLFVGVCGMGVRGAALGTVCASTVAFAAGLGLAMRRYGRHTYRSRVPACLRQLAGSLRLGLPMGAQFVFLSVGNLVLTSLVASFGPVAIAAMSIVGRLETVASRVFLDLSGAVTVLVAQRLGAKDITTIRHAVRLSLYCCCWMTTNIVAVIVVLRFPIGAVFTSSIAVIGIVARYILITYPFFVLYTVMAVAHGFFNGIGRTFVPLVCTIVSFIVARVPAAALLSRPIGLDGVIWAVDIGWFIGLVFTLAAVRYYLRSKFLRSATEIGGWLGQVKPTEPRQKSCRK
jgi:putative MATE family efflux protein